MNLLGRFEFFSSLLRRHNVDGLDQDAQHMTHRSHFGFCVAHIEATVTRKRDCIYLGRKGELILFY